MMRGIDRRDIFVDDQDRGKFLKVLSTVAAPEDQDGKPLQPYCIIHAYCLMDNHIHLLIAEGTEDIGTVMKRIGVSYVSYYNKRHERLGPLFHDRFRSEPVEDPGYFITLVRYIHLNPVEAEMVTSPSQYRWSSWHEYSPEKPQFGKAICAKSLPFANLTWKELCGLVVNISQSDEPQSKLEHRRMTDNEARKTLEQLCGSLDNLAIMPIIDRKHLIRKVISSGITMRQLSRISGIDYKTIYRVINPKNDKTK